jgi:hypothetical protein
MNAIILDENHNIIEKINDIDSDYINNKINKFKIQDNITRVEKLNIRLNNEYYKKFTKDKIIDIYVLIYGEYDESDDESYYDNVKYVIIITKDMM